jgi:hypothetical protein
MMLNRIRANWRNGLRGLVFATAVVAGIAGGYRAFAADCCAEGAACCKPGAACCHGAHMVAQR